jgi:MFS family permease
MFAHFRKTYHYHYPTKMTLTGLARKQRDVFSGMKLRERRTFYLHIAYSILDGVCLGVLALNEFIFLKDIGASAFQVSLLFLIAAFVMPFSIFLTYFVSRVKNKKKMLIRVAFYTRMPLLLFLFFPTAINLLPYRQVFIALYLAIFTAYFLATPLILPVLNLLTKTIYRPNRFGRLFSYSLIINQLALFAVTIFFGKLLDWNTDSFRYVFPVFGLLGFYAIYLITLIPYKEPKKTDIPRGKRFWRTVGRIYRDSVFILTKDKAFLDFERGMMAYGMGYNMALAVITVYLSERFLLNYTDIAFYKNIPIIVSIISFPLFGKVMDEGGDPRRFAILCFTFAALFYFFMIVAGIFPGEGMIAGHRIILFIFIGYILQGLFSASIALIWGIGATYFAPKEEAGRFHAVHLSLTGIRAIIAPVLGVIIYHFIGFYGTFAVIIILEILAIQIMWKSVKNVKRTGEL